MAALSLTPAAETDLEDIYAHIAFTDGRIQTAKKVLRGLREVCESYAAAFSAGSIMGTARPDLGETYRVFTYKRWVIVFRPIPDGIEVLRIVDGSRDWSRLFGS